MTGSDDAASAESLARTLWRRRQALVVVFVLVVTAAAGITFALPKRYTSTAYLAVEQRDANGGFDATQTTQLLARTYAELMQSSLGDGVYATARQRAGAGTVDVTAVPQSQLLAVEATGASPAHAKALADATSAQFEHQISDLARSDRTPGRVALVQTGALPAAPSAPRPRLYLVVAAVVAAVLAAGGALLAEKVDPRLDIPADAFEFEGVAIAGRFPRAGRAPAALTEAADVVLSNLIVAGGGHAPGSLAVVSGAVGEGRTTVAVAVARAAAQRGLRVLLVEADMRRPSLARRLGAPSPTGGLAAALAGPPSRLEDHVVAVDGAPRLHLLAGDALDSSPASALTPERLRALQRDAEHRFDLVVYDTPALSIGPEAAFVGAIAATRLVVVDSVRGDPRALRRVLDHLRRDARGDLALVLNRTARNVRRREPTGEAHAQQGPPAVDDPPKPGVLDAEAPVVEH